MKTIISSIKFILIFAIILGVGYVGILKLASICFAPNGGEVEPITLNGKTVAINHIGQSFTGLNYFWGRPSAVDYNASASGASNKGINNPEYLAAVNGRIEYFLKYHPYLQKSDITSELVTASGSGLDSQISPKGAEIQVGRVAKYRNVAPQELESLVRDNTTTPFLGMPYVDVVKLNIALDQKYH